MSPEERTRKESPWHGTMKNSKAKRQLSPLLPNLAASAAEQKEKTTAIKPREKAMTANAWAAVQAESLGSSGSSIMEPEGLPNG
mmetsp:Transcript_3368/g.4564  ORF Transcript_3368/g.4564 Transcript_3368/m.4564 type:complete len:84 (+) Transcript_3368:465-716(+)